MKLGGELAAITAGLDLLYRSRNRNAGILDAEGLIPVAVAEISPQRFESYDEAEAALLSFRDRLGQAETALRGDWLDEMSDSLLALIATFRGDSISFGERLERQIRIDARDIPEEIITGYYRGIREVLDELGFRDGSLFEDFARWEQHARIPSDKVLDVLAEFQRQARTRCGILATSLRADWVNDEWIKPIAQRDVPYSAYCDFPGRRLLLNVDFPYTAFGLKHLAVHEAFPGHLVHLKLRERRVAEGLMPLDAAQVVTSSASSAIFEGIADNGMQFLDWIETPEDHLGHLLQRLRSALRCRAAWQLLGEGQSFDEVVPSIAAASLQSPDVTRSRLAFLRHDLRAPFVYAYWCGEMAVHSVWSQIRVEEKDEFWNYLYNNMHTPNTLAKHWLRRI
ncbi:CalR9 protein (plasmid) [Neorhizobium galegae bv. officinalis bv. officinalis str. HAMBI 1141]|uniref:CalR9 protein n=1 Tax=Neorhizobium galegae bv. officinalis bv. officinalis str. HAMBI 1141 TaxID=1028801 RepID=A0A068TGL0_NEOGA|nr:MULTISPECIES: hypothetical protein [Neorhizobium]MCJ9669584.1 hypothetical protein [Neorhizobium sp. SHOUNA12B]MCJ9745961.1 hypothetical protein [Neorhizobium sp. SHOUNA12A]CDN57498.1 CalR9 protein [Neorhizobium galegae bv. officinalis bv. officinalis str. HAMBI 1141]